MSGYIWYSSGSDVSGPKIAGALGFSHGKKTPKLAGLGVLVGWGCKPETRQMYDPKKIRAAVENGSLRILNYPQQVTAARNKLGLLNRIREGGLAVPGMIDIKGVTPNEAPAVLRSAVDEGTLHLPCVGFNEFHKGKPVFCWTKEDLDQVAKINKSRKKGAIKLHYFRSLFHGTEYRIHVFRDEALCAEIKVLAQDPVEATAKSLFGRLKKKVEGEVKATEGELRMVVDELASDLLRGPSHLQRSVQHGWEMTDVALEEVPADVISSAISALDAVGLDMGAVGVIFEEDQAIVTNVIAAPGLDDAKLKLYTDAIQEFVGDDGASAKKGEAAPKKAVSASKGEDQASQEIIARLTRKVRTGRISQKKAEELLAALE